MHSANFPFIKGLSIWWWRTEQIL